MPEARPVELFAVARDDCVWEAKLANDVFSHKVLDFSYSDCSKGFGFDQFCEVVHCNHREFELSLALRHWADEIQSPLCKQLGTDHRGERFSGQLRN
ncbi:hypothetical protein L3X38_024957 [Prunus dulcis]|uniref:Uncharacterized protein n=1 Tax=Prunus dulcis TaxID=3755 RepID=A0AAD4Z6Z9_PRUDU|nr:hypothetical protein L3X38_024957 [Prunus dulcis]